MAVVLGLHGGVTVNQHEPSACLMVDGKIAALCEEERLTRVKSCYGMLPTQAVKAVLKIAGLTARRVDLLVTPGATYSGFAEAIAAWFSHNFGYCPTLARVNHHRAHCAAAFYGSGFDDALVLSLDGSGDGLSAMACIGDKAGLREIFTLPRENSIGAFYTLITNFLGFSDGDEYKLMGLAAFGQDKFDLSPMLRIESDGWYLNPSYQRAVKSPFEPPFSDILADLVSVPARSPDDKITTVHMDIAASAQAHLERAVLGLIRHLRTLAPSTKLCLAGGVALNCALNRRIFYEAGFDKFYVSPVASDRGLSLGCAYIGAEGGEPLKVPYLGQEFTNAQIRAELEANGVAFKEIPDPAWAARNLIDDGKVIGWFQGRSEAGARALGHRSILADPEVLGMQDLVNERIKFREKFRPFAPAVRIGGATQYFHTRGEEFPTMSITLDTCNRALPATTHIDGTARAQTVNERDDAIFHKLLSRPVLNTSFNLKGQPIVESPRDAIGTFYQCGMDAVVMGNFLVTKAR